MGSGLIFRDSFSLRTNFRDEIFPGMTAFQLKFAGIPEFAMTQITYCIIH